MAKSRPVLGLCTCPECDHPDAEVKADKNGFPYRYCPECCAQYFTHGVPDKVKRLLTKIRAGSAPPAPAPDPAPPPEQNPAPPAPEPAPAPRKNSWECMFS